VIDRPIPRALFGLTVAAASWIALIAVGLLTALLLGLVLLGIAFLRSGPAPEGQPVPFLLLALLAVTSALAGVTARYIASWQSVDIVFAGMLTLISLVEVTWALSSPYHAIYLAREMA
jgi:hypothetical protein